MQNWERSTDLAQISHVESITLGYTHHQKSRL